MCFALCIRQKIAGRLERAIDLKPLIEVETSDGQTSDVRLYRCRLVQKNRSLRNEVTRGDQKCHAKLSNNSNPAKPRTIDVSFLRYSSSKLNQIRTFELVSNGIPLSFAGIKRHL